MLSFLKCVFQPRFLIKRVGKQLYYAQIGQDGHCYITNSNSCRKNSILVLVIPQYLISQLINKDHVYPSVNQINFNHFLVVRKSTDLRICTCKYINPTNDKSKRCLHRIVLIRLIRVYYTLNGTRKYMEESSIVMDDFVYRKLIYYLNCHYILRSNKIHNNFNRLMNICKSCCKSL